MPVCVAALTHESPPVVTMYVWWTSLKRLNGSKWVPFDRLFPVLFVKQVVFWRDMQAWNDKHNDDARTVGDQTVSAAHVDK